MKNKIISLILIICNLTIIFCLDGCASKKESTANTNKQAQVIPKDESFEKLKNYLKENGTYSDNSYYIASDNSLGGMYFALSYDVLNDNIVISGKEPKSNCTGVIFFSDNESTFNYTITYNDCIYGSGTMDKSDISENTKRLNFSELEYDNNLDYYMTTDERISNKELMAELGAHLLTTILGCYMYEMLINLFPVTLQQLGFINFSPN